VRLVVQSRKWKVGVCDVCACVCVVCVCVCVYIYIYNIYMYDIIYRGTIFYMHVYTIYIVIQDSSMYCE